MHGNQRSQPAHQVFALFLRLAVGEFQVQRRGAWATNSHYLFVGSEYIGYEHGHAEYEPLIIRGLTDVDVEGQALVVIAEWPKGAKLTRSLPASPSRRRTAPSRDARRHVAEARVERDPVERGRGRALNARARKRRRGQSFPHFAPLSGLISRGHLDNSFAMLLSRAALVARRSVRLRALSIKTTNPPPASSPERLAGGEAVGLSDELEEKASGRWRELAAQHRVVPSDEAVRKKRLIYRSKQRGWLEVDLLLGTWAVENVDGLSSAECDEYEDILNCETIDIFNFITGKDPVPPRLDTAMMKRLQDYCDSTPLGTVPNEYAAKKAEANLT
ncbi:succinate dehydrogenase complex assembly factor [Aureococcus anophagefferens]|uniref:Succinate dehydrogenase complex assembly factor n=1 Tax=Aureococcus anophagefferens TaxID=44056 RepID=A0ABR1GEM4_AURAN